jgi:hypothetical protein
LEILLGYFWAIVYFGQLNEVSQIFGLLFPRQQLCITIDENVLGYILGGFAKTSISLSKKTPFFPPNFMAKIFIKL